MSPLQFDSLIKSTLDHYPPLGARAQILSASIRQTAHGAWTNVIVDVTPSQKGAAAYTEDWRYGEESSHERSPRPIGIALVDAERLIGAEKAAAGLPPGFPLDQASCDLYWAVPHLLGEEPHYVFSFERFNLGVGAYSGNLARR